MKILCATDPFVQEQIRDRNVRVCLRIAWGLICLGDFNILPAKMSPFYRPSCVDLLGLEM